MLQSSALANLKGLLVFQDQDDDLLRALAEEPMLGDSTTMISSSLAETFALTSFDLEHLSVSYMIDAQCFFRALDTAWTWHSLQSLALTSGLLQSRGHRGATSAMLHKSGAVVLGMPRLQTMVLWYSTRREACAFIYRNHGGKCYITWRGTWDLELTPHVVEIWEQVAFEFSSFQLCIRMDQVESVDIFSRGEAIYHLDLPCTVVDPVSLRQIRREGLDRQASKT